MPSSHLTKAKAAAQRYHGKVPYIRKLPVPVVGIIVAVVIANIICWAGAAVLLHFHRPLLGTAILAYTLGLRHALDADHISAIDLMTRRLIAAGQRPVSVGMFFSLGHSTIVVITSIVVAATAASFSERFDSFRRVGGIIGTSVSAAFLLILALMNAWILYKLIKEMKRLISRSSEDEEVDMWNVQGAGCLMGVFKGAFKMIDRPWKMYPLGVLFGLGFDTSSEIALLGIASIQAAQGTSIWLILIFPVLFTAGMCLLDTTDGALMSALYTSPSFAQDNIAILYYSIVLTIITIIVAVVIGTIQLLSLILNVAEPTGHFWEGVEKAGDMYDVIGGCIAGLFVVVGVASVLAYKPWRRRIDRGMLRVGDGDEGCGDDVEQDVEQDVGRTAGDSKGALREDVVGVPSEILGERSG
ncbi:high affinity nickel transport protein nic1 [Morchella conica CCBAS932]|uniref:Nickel/cobalt efflux system n=1 Tax=Morchella conica CCBAS932 TaxID=1392247 RepID=A0A3N4KTX1_9PEZI|nr:high affinity nickel transport protein nic1 [Morchella conica CCBAS932]